MDESLTLAEYIARTGYADIPDIVKEVAKKSFLDALGVTLAASTLCEGCQSFINLALSAEGKKESTVIGFDVKVTEYMAAFANGSMAHALDFEDTHDAGQVHPNASVIPAALAVAESMGNVTGKDFLTAVVLGSDIVCRLGLALKIDPLVYGWYMPPVLGAFGATTAVCKLLNLSPTEILDAFSLTLCQSTCSAEITHSSSSVIRAVRDAFAAKTGVISARLAQLGVAGFDRPLEGEAGLFQLYARGNYEVGELTRDIGHVYQSANVSFKPWPSCRGTHSFIQATLQLVMTHKIQPEAVKSVLLTISSVPVIGSLCQPLPRKRNPQTAIDAKFSIPFVVAVAIVYREVRLQHFSPQGLRDSEVISTASKILVKVDSELKAGQGSIEIELRDEKHFVIEVPEFALGHPSDPLSQEALIEKFMDCATYAKLPLSHKRKEKLVNNILNLEEFTRVVDVIT